MVLGGVPCVLGTLVHLGETTLSAGNALNKRDNPYNCYPKQIHGLVSDEIEYMRAILSQPNLHKIQHKPPRSLPRRRPPRHRTATATPPIIQTGPIDLQFLDNVCECVDFPAAVDESNVEHRCRQPSQEYS